MNAFSHYDALIPGLTYEYLKDKVNINELQIFRDDFDELKIIYQDLFEISSTALAYIGAFVNLSFRDSPDKWSKKWKGGNTRGIKRILEDRASEREFIVDEMPYLKALYDEIDRHTRNDIGHFKIYYDFKSGMLIDEKGNQENIRLFLYDLLGAVRVTFSLISFTAFVNMEYDDYMDYINRGGDG